RDASADDLLDALKHAAAIAPDALAALERALRQAPVAAWTDAAARVLPWALRCAAIGAEPSPRSNVFRCY
ncbi:hypothetical protein, partial [Verminephrobacter aporrectodeae]|uniref:hypothetical protein n=1 Tax=Verminephrobacter aporrectodeae TaxID=1110389 RepID=UPI0002376CEB